MRVVGEVDAVISFTTDQAVGWMLLISCVRSCRVLFVIVVKVWVGRFLARLGREGRDARQGSNKGGSVRMYADHRAWEHADSLLFRQTVQCRATAMSPRRAVRQGSVRLSVVLYDESKQ